MGHGRRDELHPRVRRPQRGDQPTAEAVSAHSSDDLGRDGRSQEGGPCKKAAAGKKRVAKKRVAKKTR